MALERVNPPALARPSGFSHAVVADGGRVVFLAGQVALGADGVIMGGTVAEQFERALANLLEALRAAGGGPERTWPASPCTRSTWATTGRTGARSARSGGGWPAGSTRRWPRSGCRGSGIPPRWSRSRAMRSSARR